MSDSQIVVLIERTIMLNYRIIKSQERIPVSVTHRAYGVGIGGIEVVEDVGGGVRLRAAATRCILLLVAGRGVVARARVELEGAQVPPEVEQEGNTNEPYRDVWRCFIK